MLITLVLFEPAKTHQDFMTLSSRQANPGAQRATCWPQRPGTHHPGDACRLLVLPCVTLRYYLLQFFDFSEVVARNTFAT
jgi:hypothetical protein